MGIGAVANIIVPLFDPSAGGLRAEDWLNLCILLAVSLLIVLITESLERSNRALNTALAEQRRSEAEMRAIVDSVVEGLWLVAPDQQLLSVNRQCEELLGIAASQVVGQRLDDLRPLVDRIFADPEGFASRVGASVTDTSARFKETYVQVWPQERQLELMSTPVHSDGRFLGRLYALRDVTQERELDRMKTEFVSQVSHELRTPLTAIKGFNDLLLDGDAGEINEEQAEYLGIVKQNVDRLVSLINDLLDVARMESGRITLKLAAIDLREIVALVVATMRPLIDAKDQTLTVEIAPELPPAWGDHDRILQVITNLVSNAYKYTPAGGAIRVAVAQRDERLHVAVQDTGMGIPPEDIPKLFTRFFRVDTSLTREIGGTGLGLSIVKSIVELHGGTIAVESTLGSGSTFSFDIPVATEMTPQQTPEPEPESVPAESPVADERTVLVVEDDETVRAAIAASLNHAGYHVETAGSAEDALGHLGVHKPDMIVLSMRLPDVQDLDRTSRLAEAPEIRDIPMLVLSILDERQAGGTEAPARMDEEWLLAHIHRALEAPDHGRILVIDDDPSIRELLIVALRKQGFEVLEAPDGETGLALARRAEPGLILLDLRLPGMDGFAVLQALKRAPETAEIPVIAISGSTGLWLGARARVLSLGAADFVAKPFEMTELVGEIRTLMQEKEETHADPRASR
jgi:PAS domain S-box-containing protein